MASSRAVEPAGTRFAIPQGVSLGHAIQRQLEPHARPVSCGRCVLRTPSASGRCVICPAVNAEVRQEAVSGRWPPPAGVGPRGPYHSGNRAVLMATRMPLLDHIRIEARPSRLEGSHDSARFRRGFVTSPDTPRRSRSRSHTDLNIERGPCGFVTRDRVHFRLMALRRS